MRPGGRQKYGAATAGGPPLRAGRLLTFFVRPSAAPRTQKKETPQETVAHALTAPHPVQPYCDTVARSRSRTWRFIRHTQHAHVRTYGVLAPVLFPHDGFWIDGDAASSVVFFAFSGLQRAREVEGFSSFSSSFSRFDWSPLFFCCSTVVMQHGPDDFNGYGYFFVRLYCTGLGFHANIVEEYVLLSALLHIFAGLKRTRERQKLSSGLMSCQLSFAVTVSSSRNMFC